MARCVPPVLLMLIAALCLASCGFPGRPERPVWRAQAENACFARKQVTLSDTIVSAPEIDGAVYVASRRPLRVGEIATVKIERAEEYDLHGTAVGF